jgi:hypothetical protein
VKAWVALLIVVVAACILAVPAFSFLPEFTGSQPDRWSLTAFPLQWNLNTAVGSNITGNGGVSTVIGNSFASWTSAPNTNLPASAGATSNVTQETSSPSNINLICFVCSDVSFGGSDTLAETITTTANGPGMSDGHGGTTQFAGQIIKADIVFNTAVQFDTGGGSGQNLQTVATHEIGHFFGLDHTGVARAVMYPYAPDLLTTLGYDDVAGISSLYPKSAPDVATGSIAGAVTLGGSGVFGAHVFANSTTGANPFSNFANIRKTPIGTLSNPDGSYTIKGVPADSYIVIAEPLDLPVANSDVGWAAANGKSAVQTNFTTRWH